MQTAKTSVKGYLKSLPPERAAVVSEIRDIVNKQIKAGFIETMRWGMICWEVPLEKYPNTYNKQPLNYIALAAQKNGYSLYLMSCYTSKAEGAAFEKAYKATGKRLDMGKACVRFKKVEDLPLSLITKYIRRYSLKEFIQVYEDSRR